MVKGTHNAVEDERNKDILISINGELFPRQDAKISVFDSGYLVGDGVWEAFRYHQGKMVFLDKHLDRLWQSAKVVGMHLPFSREELQSAIQRTLDANQMRDHVHVRVMVTRGIKKTPSQDPRFTISGPNVVIVAEHKQASLENKSRGITLWTSTIRRGSPDYLDPRLNCHSKLHEVQALIQALEAGADEALMLDVNGFVSTCNSTNFFMVKGKEVWTSTGQYCMNGITRGHVIELCERHGLVCREKDFSLFDLYGADEAFVTGTFGGLTPVNAIDGKPIGKGGFGSVTKQLSDWYDQLIEEEIKRQL
ncbi:Branched-chain amino acid aminotransferase [Lunatimonas lonarensis]|uniref:branched-chain-amino-acid transaminase n=1 Tax=Lunatimonas lonarensis TaxID=1232681 RepID=R7ZPA5_9BACT|nr:aminotransferase class IV [Lunatimonas lonarensis]EON75917.1 Branched-chain amino acid aminotransferase [Lunatimonas lonarensis]